MGDHVVSQDPATATGSALEARPPESPNTRFFEGVTFRPALYAAREDADLAARVLAIRRRAVELGAQGGALQIPAETIDALATRHERVTRTYWAAMGRCMSTMIAGPANFPVARNRKRLDIADRRGAEIGADHARALMALERAAFPHGLPGSAVRGDDPDALEKLKAKLATARGPEKRRLEDRISDLTIRQERGHVERVVDGIRVVENPDADRIQLIFPYKPDEAERAALKRRGFRWSPRFGAWQRHLNANGRRAADFVLSDLKARAA